MSILTLVAIALNPQTYQSLVSHPLTSTLVKDFNYQSDFSSIRIIVLKKMGDGYIILYTREEVQLLLDAHESFDPSCGIDFLEYLDVFKSNVELQQSPKL